jgi:hypothetical protein
VDPKVSGLAIWSENYKWYSSLPLGAVVSEFYRHDPLYGFTTRECLLFISLSIQYGNFWIHPRTLNTLNGILERSICGLMFSTYIYNFLSIP